MKKLIGGCLCGEVRYEADAEMLMAYNCHCRDCQHLSGTGHLSVFAVPSASLSVSGELKFYKKRGDSGNIVSMGFCPNCGSNILGKPDGAPDVIAIAAGSLDDPSQYLPTLDIFTDSAPAWDSMAESTMKLPGMFPQES